MQEFQTPDCMSLLLFLDLSAYSKPEAGGEVGSLPVGPLLDNSPGRNPEQGHQTSDLVHHSWDAS